MLSYEEAKEIVELTETCRGSWPDVVINKIGTNQFEVIFPAHKRPTRLGWGAPTTTISFYLWRVEDGWRTLEGSIFTEPSLAIQDALKLLASQAEADYEALNKLTRFRR